MNPFARLWRHAQAFTDTLIASEDAKQRRAAQERRIRELTLAKLESEAEAGNPLTPEGANPNAPELPVSSGRSAPLDA